MKKSAIFLAVAFAFVLVLVTALRLPAAQSATLQVGPGKPFATPCAAIAAAVPGSTIEIDSSVPYSGDTCAWSIDNLTIRGVGGARAHIDAGGQSSQGKAIWVISGKNTVIENIEFSGASVPSLNGAGIRQQGENLTVRNCYFHDNQEGILTDSSAASTVLIEFSDFARNGSGDGQSHNLYIGNIAQLIFRYNYSHHANIGHLLKSRAAQNVIVYNRLSDESTGNSSYQIDRPNGGLSYLIGNVIEQGPANDNATLISYLEEGVTTGNPSSQLFVVNNTFVNGAASGTFIFLATPSAPAVIKNNIFAGPGVVTNQLAAVQANNFAGAPGFVNASAYDYHLAAGSPAIGHGAAPGTNGTFSLAPAFQYVHPACAEGRTTVGVIDIGAYEFNGGTGVPPVGSACSTSAPVSTATAAPSNLQVTAFAVTATPTATPTPASNGLVAAYSFNEGTGTVVHDVSGNNNNGTIASATWTTTGRYGSALSFNGKSSLVTVPESPSLDLKTALTLEAWVKPTAAASGFQAIIFKEMPTDTAYYLYRSGFSAAPLGGVYIGAEQTATATSGLTLNSWSHMALTYNGTQEQIYVNGALVASRNQTGTVQTSSGVLHIGGDSLWGEYFLGSIDEIRIYNRALTAAEVQTDMNTAVPGSATPDATPPTVAITAPAGGASLSGAATVTASASDNVGIAGVQFQLDGANLGAEVIASPYSISWDTTKSANGSHTLTAIARDAAGNKTTSAAVTVSVSNALPANLVVLLQDAGAGNVVSMRLNVTPLSITNSSGVTTSLSSTALSSELVHLEMAPTLAVPKQLPAGSYTSVNLALANPQLVVLSNGVPTKAGNVTLAQSSISVPITSMNLAAGGTLGLTLDFDVPNSVSVDASGNYTITPVVHSATVNPSISSSMQLVDVVGQVANLPASPANSFDFQVPNVAGTVRIVTDANTVFDGGVTRFSDLQKNQFVEVEAVLQADGTFLAKYVEQSASDQSLRIQGIVTSLPQDSQGRTTGVNLVQQN
jgi:hypothetical protein